MSTTPSGAFTYCMEPLGMSVAETAQKLGVSAEQLRHQRPGGYILRNGLGLDKLFGGGASTWYQLQARYDEAQERNKDDIPEELEPLPSYDGYGPSRTRSPCLYYL